MQANVKMINENSQEMQANVDKTNKTATKYKQMRHITWQASINPPNNEELQANERECRQHGHIQSTSDDDEIQ